MFSGRTAKVCSLLSACIAGSRSLLEGCRLGGEGPPARRGAPHIPGSSMSGGEGQKGHPGQTLCGFAGSGKTRACTSHQGSTSPPTQWGCGGSERWGQQRSRPGREAPRGDVASPSAGRVQVHNPGTLSAGQRSHG